MTQRAHDILLRAIARNARVVLTFQAGPRLTHRATRLLSGVPAGFWVELPPGSLRAVDRHLLTGRPVGVSFLTGEHKLLLATAVQRQALHRVGAAERVPALLLSFPSGTQIKAAARAWPA